MPLCIRLYISFSVSAINSCLYMSCLLEVSQAYCQCFTCQTRPTSTSLLYAHDATLLTEKTKRYSIADCCSGSESHHHEPCMNDDDTCSSHRWQPRVLCVCSVILHCWCWPPVGLSTPSSCGLQKGRSLQLTLLTVPSGSAETRSASCRGLRCCEASALGSFRY